MNADDFEKWMQRQQLREIPSEWRAEILREANASGAACVRRLHPPGQKDQSLLASVATACWREWLWPSPKAWAGLAAVWLAIVCLNVTTASRSEQVAKQAPKSSFEMDASLAAQRRELARLLDNSIEPAPTKKSAPTGPRSEKFSPPKV